MNELDVSVFDWPSRFLVEAVKPDSEYPKFFKGLVDFDPLAPYLVDLEDGVEGWCGCRKFAVHVAPFLHLPGYPRTCQHIEAARRYKSLHKERPKPMPAILSLTK